jgi:hypothetical protein
MRRFLTLLLLASTLLFGQQRVFTLQSGDVITGEIISINDSTQVMNVKTTYGQIEISSEDLLIEIVEVVLKSGDIIKGQLMTESNQSVIVKSTFGIMEVAKPDVESINYLLKNSQSDRLFNSSRFSMSNEQQIDIFYEPTGYTLERGVLYLSGLSWGFGITDRVQITSRWADYIMGNFNFRPKFQIYKSGNIEKEKALSVGFHYNIRKNPLRYEWTGQEFVVDKGYYEYNEATYRNEWVHLAYDKAYYGAYNRIGTELSLGDSYYYNSSYGSDTTRYNTESNYFERGYVNTNLGKPTQVYEVFAAYTVSSAKSDGAGRNSMTFGALYGYISNSQKSYYRIYFAGAVDVKRNFIFNYEIFYDPTYVEWWQLMDYDDSGLSISPIERTPIDPIHFDIGFIYAYSDWLRFGIHFQPYLGAIYFKF